MPSAQSLPATLRIFAATVEDAHQGWVWLVNARLPARCIIKISNPATRMSVFCEALQIEVNFLRNYNQEPRYHIVKSEAALVMSAWYRAALGGIETQSEVPLEISAANSWWGQFKACTDHPQVVVRLAAWLGGIGLMLGVIGLVLGLVSLC